jgi:cell wall-associated NlpC family hydrolase
MCLQLLLLSTSKSVRILIFFLMIVFLDACTYSSLKSDAGKDSAVTKNIQDTILPIALQPEGQAHIINDAVLEEAINRPQISTAEIIHINTGKTQATELIGFAKTLIGIPYVYGSTDPKTGFDCSGFITYVFRHFNIEVPRSSIDFTDVGKTVTVEHAKQGDFILFTGTNAMETYIGHMGLVVSNDSTGLQFIHATSGKAMAVTITQFNEQYKKRFIRVARIFHRDD